MHAFAALVLYRLVRFVALSLKNVRVLRCVAVLFI